MIAVWKAGPSRQVEELTRGTSHPADQIRQVGSALAAVFERIVQPNLVGFHSLGNIVQGKAKFKLSTWFSGATPHAAFPPSQKSS